MEREAPQAHPVLKLPLNVTSRADLGRLCRELERLQEFFVSANAKNAVGVSVRLPRLTRSLDDVAKENNYNLLESNDRKELTLELKKLTSSAPQLHMSFSTDPPPKILEQITSWFRQQVHPHALVLVGLQPNLAAGCILRTTNHIFDMSLRSYVQDQENVLMQLISEPARASSQKLELSGRDVAKNEPVEAPMVATPQVSQPNSTSQASQSLVIPVAERPKPQEKHA